ncbi:hypothetical protein PoB_005188400 [Plakobranchus ocellatus]|uniref:Uncharacterized protein n=1 Tax=Plakobranchus ocellatus TaxID=259542 RepID=A0AAV4C3X1_9GAST|nr:hypothetical protein PoB_005188400 [Plakobranchus ocellatus]
MLTSILSPTFNRKCLEILTNETKGKARLSTENSWEPIRQLSRQPRPRLSVTVSNCRAPSEYPSFRRIIREMQTPVSCKR